MKLSGARESEISVSHDHIWLVHSLKQGNKMKPYPTYPPLFIKVKTKVKEILKNCTQKEYEQSKNKLRIQINLFVHGYRTYFVQGCHTSLVHHLHQADAC